MEAGLCARLYCVGTLSPEPGVHRRGDLGGSCHLEALRQKRAFRLFVLDECSCFAWTPFVYFACARTPKLDCAGCHSDALSGGGFLGRALARRRRPSQIVASGG